MRGKGDGARRNDRFPFPRLPETLTFSGCSPVIPSRISGGHLRLISEIIILDLLSPGTFLFIYGSFLAARQAYSEISQAAIQVHSLRRPPHPFAFLHPC